MSYEPEADVARQEARREEAELKARLKLEAAAPDLLKACKFLVSKYDGIDHKDIPAPIFNIISIELRINNTEIPKAIGTSIFNIL